MSQHFLTLKSLIYPKLCVSQKAWHFSHWRSYADNIQSWDGTPEAAAVENMFGS